MIAWHGISDVENSKTTSKGMASRHRGVLGEELPRDGVGFIPATQRSSQVGFRPGEPKSNKIVTLPLFSVSGKVKQVRSKGNLLSHRCARYGWLVGPELGKRKCRHSREVWRGYI